MKQVDLDASPAGVLHQLRGEIVNAQLAYPQVLHIEVRDSAGELWRLATQDAEYSPPDPVELIGKSVESAEICEEDGELRCGLSSGAGLEIKPGGQKASEGLPNWEVITPDGVVLEFGPGIRWQITL